VGSSESHRPPPFSSILRIRTRKPEHIGKEIQNISIRTLWTRSDSFLK
jgi:hypothetical protein